MFASNSPSSRWMTQEIALSKTYIRNANRRKIAYDNLIKNTAAEIISNVDKFKATIDIAISVYLDTIKNKFFRNGGRSRANELLGKVNDATTTAELIRALKTVIKKGNEEEDSLKTFLIKGISLTYNSNLINFSYEYSYAYTNLLNDLMFEVDNQLKPVCLQTFTTSSEEIDEVDLNKHAGLRNQ